MSCGQVEIVHANVHRASRAGIAKQLSYAIKKYSPDHIHMGGSIKTLDVIPKKALQEFKETGGRLTWFYGDAYNNSETQNSLLDIVDNIYITNSSHLTNPKAIPVLCPYDQKVYRPFPKRRERGVVFVGNPHTEDRARAMEHLSTKCDLEVYGSGAWQKFKVNYKGPLAHSRFSETLANYKIVLGEPARSPCSFIGLGTGCLKKMPMFKGPVCRVESCDKYVGLKQYYSNRLANVLASKSFHLVHYIDGVEKIAENGKDLVWYNNMDEAEALIEKFLHDDVLRENIADSGYELIKNYTFESMAKRIIDGEERNV